tara:strand:- start:192 stop:614 length:423 start_codon:yes stop_codon:yes gene_type:complete
MQTESKLIKYIETNIGTDKKNPLCQLRDEDLNYILNYLFDCASFFSDIGQNKNGVWEDLVHRMPKRLHRGANGPNSIMTFCLGLLTNINKNIGKYKGNCRLSKKQIDDLEFCSKCLHLADDKFDVLKFQHSLLEFEGSPV